ncbi:hypothetical protein AVO45_07030 [Ruegeria marisrubri]|uniref:Uncharacterized protein n=1 Tax=Ruegeria marisrubri TaxID=1685379 RepID=A0A0X3TYL1_9RHOB|nr:hypothetical protein [Ruegeria marisrubri]KUJ80777.1 hypothetical protein AVO45_07030 [Ruegeria marisrubri]
MARTLKDLLLALLNATLLLMALCLFLAWKVASTVDGLAATFAQNLELVAPLRDEAAGLRSELQAMRSDLGDALQEKGEQLSEASQQRIQAILTRLEAAEQRLETAQAGISDLSEAPEKLIEHAIETSTDAIADSVMEIRGCTPTS